MPTRTIQEQDTAQVLDTNPKVDRELVRRFAELEQQLKKLGVDTRPKYGLKPPLGDRPAQCVNWTKPEGED